MVHHTLAPASPFVVPREEDSSVRFDVSGVVQGVGFRPFVYRLATEVQLDGLVGNDSTRVFIEVTGPAAPDRGVRAAAGG